MHRKPISFCLALLTVGAVASVAHAQVTETYVFRDTLEPSEGAGNVLEPVYNGTGAILTSGAGFVGGSYVTHTISPSACASSPTVRAWAFPVSGGLRHPNVAPVVVTGSYSISMLMRYNPMDAGYARLVDFSGSTSDNGIYKLGAGVSFYPVGTFAAGSFIADQDVFVTITRDATSQLVSLFINGIASGTYSDTTDLYAPVASAMYFLMDNTTGAAAISETDPGVISYLEVRDTPMTPAEVAASLASICDIVACGDGTVDADEECDDSGVVNGDGCSYKCMVEPGFVCSGSPSVCSRNCGNGTLDSGEPCDDGGRADGDGCSAGCALEPGYGCAGEPSVCTMTSCASGEYQSAPPTPTMDRVCSPLTSCATGEYESTAPTATSDRICTVLTACASSEFESAAPTATSDRSCTACTVCGAGTIEEAACSATADTVCVTARDAGASDAAVADAGVWVDASVDRDAASGPTTGTAGGCGCSAVGSGSRFDGLKLGLGLAFALAALGRPRAARRRR